MEVRNYKGRLNAKEGIVRSKDPRPEIRLNRIEEQASPRAAKVHKAMIYRKG